jgi:hypothetical protein
MLASPRPDFVPGGFDRQTDPSVFNVRTGDFMTDGQIKSLLVKLTF